LLHRIVRKYRKKNTGGRAGRGRAAGTPAQHFVFPALQKSEKNRHSEGCSL